MVKLNYFFKNWKSTFTFDFVSDQTSWFHSESIVLKSSRNNETQVNMSKANSRIFKNDNLSENKYANVRVFSMIIMELEVEG